MSNTYFPLGKRKISVSRDVMKEESEFLYVFVFPEEKGFTTEEYELSEGETTQGVLTALMWLHTPKDKRSRWISAAAMISLLKWDVKLCGMDVKYATEEDLDHIFSLVHGDELSRDMVEIFMEHALTRMQYPYLYTLTPYQYDTFCQAKRWRRWHSTRPLIDEYNIDEKIKILSFMVYMMSKSQQFSPHHCIPILEMLIELQEENNREELDILIQHLKTYPGSQ